MFAAGLFKERRGKTAGRSLYAAAVAQARLPAFYLAGVPDSAEGRFELYAMHVLLILQRLKGQGGEAAEVSQATFDAFLRGLDDGLREMGVGDLSVGKKMRKLGEAVYGRAKSYDAALGALPDLAGLAELLGRTVLEGGDTASAPHLAAYAGEVHAALAGTPLEALYRGEIAWPSFAA